MITGSFLDKGVMSYFSYFCPVVFSIKNKNPTYIAFGK
jgi:hypothetical protein